MTSVKTYLHTTIAAVAMSFGLVATPAGATVNAPFGIIRVGGFGISPFPVPCYREPCGFGIGGAGGNYGALGFDNPWWDISQRQPGAIGYYPGMGVGNAGPGAGGYYTGFRIETPWGWMEPTPGFGVGNAGPGAGGYYTGWNLPKSFPPPWNPLHPYPPSWSMSPQQALWVETPWMSYSPYPGFGISTPWGSVSAGGFGVDARPSIPYMPSPYMPTYIPRPH